MNLKTNILVQIILTLGQVVNAVSGYVPQKYAIVLALVQAVVGVFAHYYNTDGTPQTKAFIKPLSLLLIFFLLSGCMLTSVSDQIKGMSTQDMKDLVALENAQLCVYFKVNGNYIGNSGVVQVIGSVGAQNAIKNCLPSTVLTP